MEKFQIVPEQPVENQEHFNKMLESGEQAVQRGNTKFDENGNLLNKPKSSVDQPAQQTQEPLNNNGNEKTDDIPEKFKDKDGNVNYKALLDSYKELEKKVGSKPNEVENTEEKPQENKDGLKIESVQDAVKIATEKGINFNALEAEYVKLGNISEDSFKMLESKGISREVVQQFIDGQKAQADAIRSEILNSVGGEEKYIEIATWAKNNLSDSQLASYNKAMETNDRGIIELAVNGLKAKYEAVNGITPKLISGKTPSSNNTSSVQPYQSMQQYVDAMKDKRYSTDKVYRDSVIARVAISKF